MLLGLLLMAASAACPADKVEIHGVAAQGGKLEVYSGPGTVDAQTVLSARKPWSVCVDPTDHPIKADGPYVPWFHEVQYTYSDGTTHHERWKVPHGMRSVGVERVRTDGALK